MELLAAGQHLSYRLYWSGNMKNPGRISAAIAVLEHFQARKQPLKMIMADWGRQNRFAGSTDRAWIAGLVRDVLRRQSGLCYWMGSDQPRALCLGALYEARRWPIAQIEQSFADVPFGPGALTPDESACLAARETGRMGTQGAPPDHVAGDCPEWLMPSFWRAFGDEAVAEARAFTMTAPVGLRVNTLKATPEKACRAAMSVQAQASDILQTALIVAARSETQKAPAIDALPAYAKGWIEVQDLGSQLCALAAGPVAGRQILDLCAGGGGKTLALAARMKNTGQIFAYDRDARRLAPIFARLQRAGIRNTQIRSPAENGSLEDLRAKMDVVLVDAPCSGTGTWRRKPETKWRLSLQTLRKRQEEQDKLLAQAADFVRPGGRLVYVTCSVLPEENEDRVIHFLQKHPTFAEEPCLPHVLESGLVSTSGLQKISQCVTSSGALRFTPHRVDTDGFFVSQLVKRQ